MSGDESGVIGITLRDLPMELRDDIRALRSVVDSMALDQARLVERRASIDRAADTITARLDSHEKATLDLRRSAGRARSGSIRASKPRLAAGQPQ